jgi:hypothetical protein
MIRKLPSLLLLLVVSCASLGPKFQTYKKSQSKNAVVYIYRPRVMSGMMWSHEFKLDGKVVGSLASDSYAPLEVSPGIHKITLHLAYEDVNEIDFQVRSGETYYLRSNQDIPNLQTRYKVGSPKTQEDCQLPRAVAVSVLEEKLEEMDTRVQTSSCAPSLMFVSPASAAREIKSLQQSLNH